jgi:hypothetical protein
MRRIPQSKNVRPAISQIYLIEAVPAYIAQHSPELNDRESMLEEYIANIGYQISNYVKEKDKKFPCRWIVDFFTDESKESMQSTYKLMRYVPKVGKFNSLDEMPLEFKDWRDRYGWIERMGSTLVVVSNAQQLNTFGTYFCTHKRLPIPPNNIFINDMTNYFFGGTENWKGSPIPKYDGAQQKTYIEIQSRLRQD